MSGLHSSMLGGGFQVRFENNNGIRAYSFGALSFAQVAVNTAGVPTYPYGPDAGHSFAGDTGGPNPTTWATPQNSPLVNQCEVRWRVDTVDNPVGTISYIGAGLSNPAPGTSSAWVTPEVIGQSYFSVSAGSSGAQGRIRGIVQIRMQGSTSILAETPWLVSINMLPP